MLQISKWKKAIDVKNSFSYICSPKKFSTLNEIHRSFKFLVCVGLRVQYREREREREREGGREENSGGQPNRRTVKAVDTSYHHPLLLGPLFSQHGVSWRRRRHGSKGGVCGVSAGRRRTRWWVVGGCAGWWRKNDGCGRISAGIA